MNVTAVSKFDPVMPGAASSAVSAPSESFAAEKPPLEKVAEQQRKTAVLKKPNFDIMSLSEDERKRLEEELKKLNDSIASYNKMLRFRYNEEAEQTYVEVIDTSTQEVVASLPPEFLIDLTIRMKELIGLFIDKKI
jgi:flagellar protein FlaG